MCATHAKPIQELVRQLLKAPDQGMPQPEDDAGEEYGGADDIEIQAGVNPEPLLPAPQPAQPQPVRVLRNLPRPVNIQPARDRQPAPVSAGRRGALAAPVAPLPLALAIADRNVYQGGEPRFQRQIAVQNLTRISREDTAASIDRRLKVTSWRSAVCLDLDNTTCH